MRPSAAAGMWSCSLETKFKAAAEVYRKALSLNNDDLFKPHKSQRPSKSVETPPNCFEYQNKHKLKRILVPSNLNKWNKGGVLPLKRNEACVNMQHCGRQNSLRTQVGLFPSQTDRSEAKMLGGKIVKTEMRSKSSVCKLNTLNPCCSINSRFRSHNANCTSALKGSDNIGFLFF